MNKLQKATDEFIKVISDPLSSNENVNASLQPCFKILPDSAEEDVNIFMERLITLTTLPNMERASLATTICGYLVENGFPSEAVLYDFIDFYEELLDKSRPFFEILSVHINKMRVVQEEREEAINQIYSELLNDEDVVDNDIYNAVISLDKFYACGISLFSINRDNFEKAKIRLKDKVAFVADYSEGCFWINKLFTVLFDESIVVIDIDNKIGFEGKINGIVDNYQLQHLLMGLPILNNGDASISEENLAIANGTGPQNSENSIENKWNMYHLGLCRQSDWEMLINNKENPSQSVEYRQHWIWSESSPVDIPVYDGCRVILLGLPSYSRSSRVQRTFKNLKADIIVARELSGEEINKWLHL
ncbi:MAG: hypothetical protein ACK5KT_04055 [Dysgonomonas sp.]